MSKAQWPKFRARKSCWQETEGITHESTSYQINCRPLNGARFQRSFKDKKDAETDAARLCNERSVELNNRTVSLNHHPAGFVQGLESCDFARDLEPVETARR